MGTIILTGANGSLGLCAAKILLESCPDLTLVLTVRATSSTDANTSNLRAIVAKYPERQVQIHELDLSSLAKVKEFTDQITASIDAGQLPRIKAIICAAMYWNLIQPAELTADGYDRTIQVGHIAHAALILRLIRHFAPKDGRIVLMSSVNHIPGKSPMEKIPPNIPENIDAMVHPKPSEDHAGQGMEIYSNSKLLVTTWGHALNGFLEQDADLSSITAVMIDPGTLCDSRAFVTNTPRNMANLQRFILRPLRFFMSAMRTSATAATDVVDFATNKAHPGERGYFTLLEKTESSPQSMDKEVQQRVWSQTAAWANIDL
ncbi:NAD(P)-binding protein [Hypoxylon argillaceum]|nr:NAD(P)-binding protein [Hypoxylon argillaceum]